MAPHTYLIDGTYKRQQNNIWYNKEEQQRYMVHRFHTANNWGAKETKITDQQLDTEIEQTDLPVTTLTMAILKQWILPLGNELMLEKERM